MGDQSIQDGDRDLYAKAFDDDDAVDQPIVYSNQASVKYSDSETEGKEEKTLGQKFLGLLTAKNGYVLVLIILCIALGTVNRVVYKIQLVPMEPYAIFISDALSVAYTVVYFAIFFFRWYQGNITKDMFWTNTFPYIDYRYIIMGFMDATGQITGIYGARKISGFLLTLLPQAVIPMTMVVCIILLKTRYNLGQVAGAATLIIGITITLIPSFIHGNEGGEVYWAVLYLMSSLPNAISFTLKELVFAARPGLDIFVVNSFDSVFQLIFTLFYLPIVGIPGFGAVPFPKMGTYIHDGFKCVTGAHTIVKDKYHSCHGMPWATIIYITVNLSWNICILLLVKQGGAVLTFIALGVSLPLANLAFIWSWPLLKGKGFDGWDLVALVVVLAGLVIYRYFSIIQKRREEERKAAIAADAPIHEDTTYGIGQDEEEETYTFDANSGSFKKAQK